MAEKRNPIIAALDVATAEQALRLAQQIAPAVGAFKIGSELFTAAGPDIVKKIRATGASVFLDLKFHDIPNTVAKAVASATRLDVQMLTIHTSGGGEMMRAAEKSAQDTAKQLGLQRADRSRRDGFDEFQQRNARGNRLRSERRKNRLTGSRNSR